MAFAPKLLVDRPALVPRKNSLASVIDWRSDPRAVNGIEFEADPGWSTLGVIGDIDCEDSISKSFDGPGAYVTATPFTLYAGVKCGTVGTDRDDLQGLARKSLEDLESYGISRAVFGNGTSVTTPGRNNIPPSLSSPMFSESAFAKLYAEFTARYHGTGVVLLQPSAAILLGKTLEASEIPYAVVDFGQDNDQPIIEIIIVPYIVGYRSEVFEAFRGDPQLDPSNNDLYAIAERTYVVAFDAEKSIIGQFPWPRD